MVSARRGRPVRFTFGLPLALLDPIRSFLIGGEMAAGTAIGGVGVTEHDSNGASMTAGGGIVPMVLVEREFGVLFCAELVLFVELTLSKRGRSSSLSRSSSK
jgi:hypothetical protein